MTFEIQNKYYAQLDKLGSRIYELTLFKLDMFPLPAKHADEIKSITEEITRIKGEVCDNYNRSTMTRSHVRSHLD